MKLKSELNENDNLTSSNRMLKTALLVCSFGFLINYFQIAAIREQSVTTLVFPQTAESIEFKGNEVSERYLMMAMEYLTSNYFSVSPATVKIEFSNVLRMVHPKRFGVIQERLDSEAQKILDLKTVSMFGDVDWSKGILKLSPESNKYPDIPNAVKVSVGVSRSIYVGSLSDNPAEVEDRILSLEYVVENGRLWLLDLYQETNRATL